MVKYFWINNPKTKSDGYCVNFNGFLVRLKGSYEFVSLDYKEILDIIKKETKEDIYSTCK